MERKETIRKEIEEMESFRDYADVTAEFYITRRENVQLQAELDSITQNNEFLQSIKTRLDEQVRKERERAAEAKKARIEQLVSGVYESLKDPKLQDTIMARCLQDLEKMEAKALA